MNHYVVWEGRRLGVYQNWTKCSEQVSGYKGARFKRFDSKELADDAFYNSEKYAVESGAFLSNPEERPRENAIAVDASFKRTTKELRFRAIDLETGEELFSYTGLYGGTNNVGEFLAVVHAMVWVQGFDPAKVIYTDSTTALWWINRGKCGNHAIECENEEIRQMIIDAESYLSEYPQFPEVARWKSKEWGEIAADFGEKKSRKRSKELVFQES